LRYTWRVWGRRQPAGGPAYNGFWISEQLSKLQAVYSSSGVVFLISLLTTSTWRDYLVGVTRPQSCLLNYALMQIASLTNGGKKLIVRISEMNDFSYYGYHQIFRSSG